MDELKAQFKIVTPLFLGGAETDTPELRPPSIKGAMRFWYRAIDPDYRKWEERIFGSADAGQGSFLLRVKRPDVDFTSKDWQPCRYDTLETYHPNMPSNLTTDQQKTWILNGLRYLSYPFKMGDNNRKYILPGARFVVEILFKDQHDAVLKDQTEKAVKSSLWLLGHIGGLGSRSRRGFGTVALENDLPGLRRAHGVVGNSDAWFRAFTEGLNQIKGFFHGALNADHTVIGASSRFYLFKVGEDKKKKDTTDFSNWEMAILKAGNVMQKFRMRRQPDYDNVKGHLVLKVGLKNPPERTAFGLPLTFRYSSMPSSITLPSSITFMPASITFDRKDSDRNASSVHIRIVNIGGLCHPFYILLNAPFVEVKGKGTSAMGPPSDTILMNFFDEILKPISVV